MFDLDRVYATQPHAIVCELGSLDEWTALTSQLALHDPARNNAIVNRIARCGLDSVHFGHVVAPEIIQSTTPPFCDILVEGVTNCERSVLDLLAASRFGDPSTRICAAFRPGFFSGALMAAPLLMSLGTVNLAIAQAGPASTALNIRNSGARCDGHSDDYSAITAVLQSASKTPNGVVIFAPSSTACMVSRALVVPDNVTVQATPGSVTIKATQDNKSTPMLMEVGNNVRVDGLSFDGGGSDQPNPANVIQGFKVANVVLDHIAVRNTRGIALLMSSNITNSTVENSTFENIGNHWKTDHQRPDRIQGVVFCCGTGNHGNTISNNQFSDIGLDAVQMADQSDFKVIGNHFNLDNRQRQLVPSPDYPSAIFAYRVDNGTIQDNVVVEAPGNCIDAPGITNVTIEHNSLSGCGGAGIGLFDSGSYKNRPLTTTDHVTVSANTITNTNRAGGTGTPGAITLSGKVTNVAIKGNTLSDTQSVKTQLYGVFGHPGSTLTGLLIDPSNKIEGNAKSPVGGTAAIQGPNGATVPQR